MGKRASLDKKNTPNLQITQIGTYEWKISKDSMKGMRVPAIIYSDKKLIKDVIADRSLIQVANAAHLPGIVKASLAMPDIHFGYGLPIGGVVATSVKDGIVTPGGVGYDINCGVRLLKSNLKTDEVKTKLKFILQALYNNIPCGVGSTGKLKLNPKELKKVLLRGSKWAIENGYGYEEELARTEENGNFSQADAAEVSKRAFERGSKQLGTLGSGNHFVEIQEVDYIFDEQIAASFGLFKGQLTVMIHSGSRGLGHQVCTDFLSVMNQAVHKYKISIPDRQLACAPIKSEEGKRYLAAMRCAANFAWANRQIMAHWAREAFMHVLNITPRDLAMTTLYDVAHNIVKFENFPVDGENQLLAVHRKGATRAFPPGHKELSDEFKNTGQPVIIPGDMGTHSYVLAGTEKAFLKTFGSSCHGAGRTLSRTAAMKKARGRSISDELAKKGIQVMARSRKTLGEEMPEAYKDIERVVNIVHNSGISKKIVRMKPIAVMKG